MYDIDLIDWKLAVSVAVGPIAKEAAKIAAATFWQQN